MVQYVSYNCKFNLKIYGTVNAIYLTWLNNAKF